MLEQAWIREDRTIGKLAQGLPDNHQPAELPLVIAPRAIEACFQTAALREIAEHGKMGLPWHVGQATLFRATESAQSPLFAVVTPGAQADTCEMNVVDADGNQYLKVSGYRMVEHPDALDAEPLKALLAQPELVHA